MLSMELCNLRKHMPFFLIIDRINMPVSIHDWLVFYTCVCVPHSHCLYGIMVAPALECVWMGSSRGKGMGRDILPLIFKSPKFGEFEGEGFHLYLKSI